ncbi:4Fe-4S binding protein [Fusibacter sp. 3D3]|uniref:4Fe-4S binding protein n=1 Tax=Fusibacter sp. 3D3 TaxID=1048380 RepID=UPI0008538AC5|nr:4Fe-4S binding protein [Fusibacter sp. 3D3]GAU78376.1 ferredoxin [Fusibacter sp. 3D3]
MIRGFYFSATGTTKIAIETVCRGLSRYRADEAIQFYDFTGSESRLSFPSFFETALEDVQESDVLLLGVPVYAGRIPNILLKTLDALCSIPKAKIAYAVPIVLYGNRHYDSALNELGLILHEKGFSLLGAAAFIGEHSFSDKLAMGRPNEQDVKVMRQFSEALHEIQQVQMRDEAEKKERVFFNQRLLDQLGGAYIRDDLKPYYRPKNANGDLFDFRTIKPITTEACTDCGLCINICPMGAIDQEHPALITGVCIKCCACVKRCPTSAKVFSDPKFIFHKTELEDSLKTPKQLNLFLRESREKHRIKI